MLTYFEKNVLVYESLIKVYIVYYFACKLARAKNETCFSFNYAHYNNNNNKYGQGQL